MINVGSGSSRYRLSKSNLNEVSVLTVLFLFIFFEGLCIFLLLILLLVICVIKISWFVPSLFPLYYLWIKINLSEFFFFYMGERRRKIDLITRLW